MRERTVLKVEIAAALYVGGETKADIAALLHVSPRRVTRMLNTPEARKAFKEIRDKLSEEIIQLKFQRLVGEPMSVPVRRDMLCPIEAVRKIVVDVISNRCQNVHRDTL